MSKINETNYPRRTQASYEDTDMLVIQKAGGNTYTTRIEDLREDCQETLAPALNTMRENLATVEGSTASKAYAKGDFLVFGGRLCKAKTSIASGATLVLDTNIELDSVGDELKTLNSDLASVPMLTVLWASPNVAEGIVDNIALSESVFNFHFLMLCAKTNTDYTYQLVPTASIDTAGKDHSILTYMAGGAWNATTNQYAYTGIAGFVFKNGTDGTKFTSVSQCNNVNWRPKPYYISGFMRK